MFKRFAFPFFNRPFSKLAKFEYQDPFHIASQLTEDERLIQKMAQDFAQKTLFPTVISNFRHETFQKSIRDHPQSSKQRIKNNGSKKAQNDNF